MAERAGRTARRGLSLPGRVALAAGTGLGLLLLALWRRDIPYAALEARYGDDASRFLLTPDGLRLHYRDTGPRDGPALVLVHGYAASSAEWDPWIERLRGRVRLIALDLPGHGLTAAPDGYAVTVPGLVATLRTLLTALGTGPAVLVGSSMGGHVAWRFALDHPDGLAGLVLVGSIGWADTRRGGPRRPAALRLLGSALGRFALRHLDLTPLIRRGLRGTFGDPRLATEAAVRRTADLLRAPGHRAILMDVDAGGGDGALLGRLGGIEVPVLVMAGEADRLVPVGDARRFADAIPGAALVTYPGVGHVPMVEVPDRSAADLLAWLGGATSSGARQSA